MKVLSIDVGIKNLAYILIEHNENDSNYNIIDWNVLNLCNFVPNCCNEKCKFKAKFGKEDKFFCKKHTKNEDYQIPTINTKTLTKKNIKELIQLCEEHNIILENNSKKSEIIKAIEDYISNTCFDLIEEPNANNVNLIDLGINLKIGCNELLKKFDILNVDQIILENQISPLANRMKTLQGMITQFFIDKGNYNIKYISAINKLRLFIKNKNTKEKTSYSERKKLSIIYSKELLEKNNKITELDFFSKHSKKDDLADCFLQSIYYFNAFNKLIL